ncbi:MAG: prepilin peptidase [Acidimicrobiales bacterium]
MDTTLVGGCAGAGALAGALLDLVAARVPAPAATAAGPSADDLPAASPVVPGAGRPATAPALDVAGDAAVSGAPLAPSTAELLAAALAGGLTFGLAAARLGPVPALGAYCALFAGLVALSVVDLRVGLLPRTILYPTAGLVAVGLLAASAAGDEWAALGRAAASAAVALVVFFGIWWVYPRGLGFGDVRLAGVMAAALGWLGYGEVYVGFVAGFLLGAVIGVVKMAVQGTGRRTRLPFGPALAAGCMVGVLWGSWLANAWLSHPA